MEQVAESCNLKLEKIKLEGSEFLQNWIDTTWYFESPMNHPGTVCLLQLNRKAKEKVSVLLCGEGADETLGGYPRFSRYMFYYKYPLLRKIYLFLQRKRSGDVQGMRDGKGYAESFIKETQFVNSELVQKIYSSGNTVRVITKRRKIFDGSSGTPLRQLINYEINTYLQDILMRADKISMAASVELRVPYLQPALIEKEIWMHDQQIVSPVFRNMKKCMISTKKILKHLCAGYFGDSFTYREKIGLAVDLRYYFMQEDVKQYIIHALLPGIRERKLFNYKEIENIWGKISNNNVKTGNGYAYELEALWVVLSFEMWCQMYIDSSPLNCLQAGL